MTTPQGSGQRPRARHAVGAQRGTELSQGSGNDGRHTSQAPDPPCPDDLSSLQQCLNPLVINSGGLSSVQVIHSSGTVPSHLPSPTPRTLTLTILLPTPLRPKTHSLLSPSPFPCPSLGRGALSGTWPQHPPYPSCPQGDAPPLAIPHPLRHWVTHVSKVTPSRFANPVPPRSSYPFSALSLMSSLSFLSFSPRAHDSNQVPCPP